MEFSVIYDTERTPKGVDRHEQVQQALASEFRKVQSNNPLGCIDSFQNSFWMHCETVAKKLGCRLTVGKTNEPLFDFVSTHAMDLHTFNEYCSTLQA